MTGRRLVAMALGLVLASGCPGGGTKREGSTAKPRVAPTPAANALYVPPESVDFKANAALVKRLTGSAHGYFRFVNPRFCREVCRRFKDAVRTMPALNLHGDPHLEQYAVTSLGRGLTDFDDSTSGPGIVDLVRFGVSVRLACRQRGWQAETERAMDAFLEGYRAGLRDPDKQSAEPPMAARIRAAFRRDQQGFYRWVESLMKPLTVDRAALVQAMGQYAAEVHRQQPELPEGFFTVKKLGSLQQGVGSALDEKYLLRVEGPTAAADDDVVLEAKEVRPPSGASCVERSDQDPFRIMVVQARLAYRPYRYLGYMRRGGRMLWVHEWMELYKQLALHKPKYLASADDLVAVARDVGQQLGRGHTNQVAAPLGPQLRRRQLELVKQLEPRIKQTVLDLEQLTLAAWRRFKRDLKPPN